MIVLGMIARCNFEDIEDSGSVDNHLARAFTTPSLLFDVERRGILGYAFLPSRTGGKSISSVNWSQPLSLFTKYAFRAGK